MLQDIPSSLIEKVQNTLNRKKSEKSEESSEKETTDKEDKEKKVSKSKGEPVIIDPPLEIDMIRKPYSQRS